MPQGRKSAEEILGIAPERKSAEEILGLQPARPSAEQVLGLTPQAPEPEKYSLAWFRRQLGLGAEALGQKVSDVAATGGEIISHALSGDFTPLAQEAELIGRGALRTFTTSNRIDPATGRYLPNTSQDQRIAELEAQQAARRQAEGSIYFRGSQIENARIAAEEAKDPSIAARVVRGLPQALPYVGAATATGGSSLALGATGAALSLAEPERLAGNVALSMAPAPPIGAALRATAGAVRKLLGPGAAQIVEQEAEQGAAGAIRAMGPASEEAAISAGAPSSAPFSVGPAAAPSSAVNATIQQAASQVPKSLTRKVIENTAAAYHVPRAVMASADISAPFRQGAIFTISNPTMAARASIDMFRAFRTKNFEEIAQAIAEDADAQLGQSAGLHLGSQAKDGLKAAEEAFISKWAGKIPIVKQSEQAYTAYLDTLRVQKFSQYKQLIDEAGLSAQQTQDAYAAAAKWINIATGRGSLGKKFDQAMPLLNTFFFAPRYAASRLNVLNPIYYANNLRSAGGRIILQQQAKELFAFASVVGSTMALAKYGLGADVSLNPNDSDFLKIKAGNYRFDLGAGLTQAMRLIYRTSAALARVARGDKAERGHSVIDIGERYLRSKLGPVPSWFVDAVERKTYVGKPYSTFDALKERVLPIQWNDWIEAGWNDGIGGVLKVTPGVVGIGVERHEGSDSLLQRAQPLFSEYTRAGRSIPEIRRAQGEADDAFKNRVTAFGQGLETYGMQLVGSDEYRSAPVADRNKALDLLPRRISSALIKQGESWQLQPRVIMSDVRESQQTRGR